MSKATEGARNKSQVALTALKNAILGSDVGNRSVQIKIEKSSGKYQLFIQVLVASQKEVSLFSPNLGAKGIELLFNGCKPKKIT